jgi:5'(3')-deoxyribonucleotidase
MNIKHDRQVRQVAESVEACLNWLNQKFPELPQDKAVECATRMAMSVTLLSVSENGVKATVTVDGEYSAIQVNSINDTVFVSTDEPT